MIKLEAGIKGKKSYLCLNQFCLYFHCQTRKRNFYLNQCYYNFMSDAQSLKNVGLYFFLRSCLIFLNICVLKYVCDSQICDIQVTVFIEPKKLPKKKTQVIWNKLFSDAIHLVGCLEDQALLSPPGLGNKLPCLCRQHLDLPQKDLHRIHLFF